MNYEMVKYDSIYNDQICTIEKELWSPDFNVNQSYLQWKYFENPYTELPKIYLALKDDKLVAVRGMCETKWQAGNSTESFIAPCAADLCILPEYRNKGLYTELMKFVINDLRDMGYEYIFNFSANPANLISSLAMGWKSIGRIKIMRKEFYSRPLIKKLTSY